MFEPQILSEVGNGGGHVVLTRLPMGAELQAAFNLIPPHTWYANSFGVILSSNEVFDDIALQGVTSVRRIEMKKEKSNDNE